jgi:uncharacterized protein
MTNHLAHSQSLYLRKHAENPIDWWAWCDEALAAARSQDKPIFLSIGYSSCHWCTVMESEAFSDTVIASYMNTHFIAIKVDREERPDLDSIYMQAVQIMGENGGWPLNVFLTPEDLVPFYGGTYFPVEPRYGRPGFLKVLQSLNQIYREKRQEIQSYKDEIVNNLHLTAQLKPAVVIPESILVDGIQKCASVVVNRGVGTCFPMMPYADLVLRSSRFNSPKLDQADLFQKANQRGLDLVMGGIYDHVAGGWHRYTVDPTWTVPHFEKMLYDNGQIMEYLANLWASGVHEPAIARAIEQTATWLQREMLTEEGYFYASQDADSEGKEGKFWVWSYHELKKLFTEAELRQLAEEFTLTPEGNFEGQNVLRRKKLGNLSDRVEVSLIKLFRLRYGEHSLPSDAFPPARNQEEVKSINWSGRVPPVTDTKMIVAWNALMISGLASSYRVFGVEKYKQLAIGAADFILQNQWAGGNRLHRVSYDGNPSIPAQSEDYALLIKALLDLAQACPDLSSTYLDAAVRVQTEFDQRCWDDQSGGYFTTAKDASNHLLIKERSYQDNATPAANGIAIANLIRLSLLTRNLDYLSMAEATLKCFTQAMSDSAIACPSLLMALDLFYNHTLVRTTADLYQTLQQQYHPVATLQVEAELPSAEIIGLVCQGLACLEPATSNDQLSSQLANSQTRQL